MVSLLSPGLPLPAYPDRPGSFRTPDLTPVGRSSAAGKRRDQLPERSIGGVLGGAG
ncbi:hypothetical protein ACIBF5_22785 [Micromonospora sp. NPDC050417]|uniref:hypothetical protein n=1 Tax=Micromonospora sp. NPDC050417 TaxID=3364280 RepID=UPI0037B43373